MSFVLLDVVPSLLEASVILLTLTLLLTGCTTTLKDENKKVVINPDTGQSLTKNILCQPENKETLKNVRKKFKAKKKEFKENKVELEEKGSE